MNDTKTGQTENGTESPGFLPHDGVRTEADWKRRQQEIAELSLTGIIAKTEQEYMPFGECCRARELFKPWLPLGLTKAIWVEQEANGLQNCSIVHWNTSARLYDNRDKWPAAKRRFLTRNDGWKPKNSSSPMFGLDVIKNYDDRNLPPAKVLTKEEKQEAKEAKAAVKAGQPVPGTWEEQPLYHPPLTADEAIDITTMAAKYEVAEATVADYERDLAISRQMLRDQEDWVAMLIANHKKHNIPLPLSQMPEATRMWLATMDDPPSEFDAPPPGQTELDIDPVIDDAPTGKRKRGRPLGERGLRIAARVARLREEMDKEKAGSSPA
jgi:hypothetical protein